MDRAEIGDLVHLLGSDRKGFLLRLESDNRLETHRGIVQHEEMIGKPWGSEVNSHLGFRFHLYKPGLRDVLLQLKRKSQILYPKDIGYILIRLSLGPGTHVVEAGTGSGALTTALAWIVGDHGKVYSYDRREDMQELAVENLKKVGLDHRVEFYLQDIGEGFHDHPMDALFLDLPNPYDYLDQASQNLIPGGMLGAILPTFNQVSMLLSALEQESFDDVEVCELLLRFYKTTSNRIRPLDRMIAHTGYLIFARMKAV